MLNLNCLLLTLGAVRLVNGHGYMKDPPARNTMWRQGFPNPPNYNDNENFCGGATYQATKGGKCGVCGDPYGKAQPHADGGRFANGIIVRNYNTNQNIKVTVRLTMAHLGYFEFRIGPKARGDSIGKLQGRLLEQVKGGTRFYVTKYGAQDLDIHLRLPRNYKCKKCVIQWWYRGGNNWGCDKNGCGKGHGTQEHFVNCADVSVTDP